MPEPSGDQSNAAPELVCPAGTPAALRTAVDAGAHTVYCGFRDATNARNFPGLNFTPGELHEAVRHAHARDARVLLAVNTFAPAGKTGLWKEAVRNGIEAGVDAFIVADMGVAAHIAGHYPEARMHLSVQAGAPSVPAIRFYCEEFGVKRVVLPRILTVPEIRELRREIPCEIECFVFGNHGLMAEGRCSLSNHVTGLSTNMDGVCSPPADVRYNEDTDGRLTAALGDFDIDSFACGEKPGYPTICKGRYRTAHREDPYYAFEVPVSLNLAELLPELIDAGVSAFKIEGRQRSRAYVRAVVSAWRRALDQALAGQRPEISELNALAEGRRETQGAYGGKRWR